MANGTNGHSWWPTWQSNRLFTLLLAILLAYAIVWLGTLVKLNLLKMQRVGVADSVPTITIDGTGKVTGTPTIAQATLGLETRAADVPEAQRKNTETMNVLIAKTRELGIASEDMQTTNYSVQPNYRYDPGSGQQSVDGYVVTQQVTVKIRDLTKIGAVLDAAGVAGLNQVSGLNFTIDDPEVLRAEARAKAITQVREQAARMSGALGVRLGRVVSVNEYKPDYGYQPYALERGFGGGGSVTDVQTGSLDVVVQVSVTYEIE